MNFIINAGESIPPKSDGKIEISTGSCEVAPAIALVHSKEYDIAAGPYVWLEVRDDGAGMDEATLSRVFDPFFTTKFTGRGLGLATIHEIVRTYRGFIDVRSSPGAGAAFRVFLPASEKTRATEPASRVPRQQHRGDSTILVVDDEEMVRRLACMILRSHGYEVLEAKDGKDALEVLANCSTLPSLAQLDLAMPVMGGDELVPILQAKYAALKVVISSGYPEEESRKDSPSGAVAGFLQKPYAPVAVIEKIGEVLGRSPPTACSSSFPVQDSRLRVAGHDRQKSDAGSQGGCKKRCKNRKRKTGNRE
jgi:CheY-like chemotaxis protein